MKKLLLSISAFSASVLLLNAQVTLTKTLPPIGTRYMFGQYSGTISAPTSGLNQTWDYSSDSVSSMFEYEIVTLSTLGQALQDSFPDAKYVEMLKIGSPNPDVNPMEFIKDDGNLLLRLGNKGSGTGLDKKTDTIFNFNQAFQTSSNISNGGVMNYAGTGTVKIKGKTHNDVVMFIYTNNGGADTGYTFYKVTPHYHRLMMLSTGAPGRISLWDPLTNNTGITEIQTNNAAIYPNPANNVLNVVLKDAMSNAKLTIIDITGKAVLNTTTSLNNTEVNIQSLNPGLYFITVQTGNITSTQKFIKQ